MMFTSCQKSMDTSSFTREDASEVRLKLNVKSPTKAFVESTAEVLEANGFKVAAVKADNSVLFNSAVIYNSADGTFSVPDKHYYFPTGSKMAFYAAYPASQAIAVDAEGKATIAYSQNGDTDLVGAKAVEVESTSDPVLMTFGHLLSQVSVKAQGTDPDYSYKLKTIKITDATGGTYAFADNAWTPGDETQAYMLFNGEKDLGVSQPEAVGDTLSFIPGDVKLTAVWQATRIGEDSPAFDNDVTVDLNLEQGKHTMLNLFLPADPDSDETLEEIFFTLEISEWVNAGNNVFMKPPYVPELLSGVFTVCASPLKKVKFTKGNLYWNGSAFRCETNQYDYPTAWDAIHVGHFYWSKDVRVAYAENYDAANTAYGISPAGNDTFYAADGGVFEGLTVLSKDEWDYLITNALAIYEKTGPIGTEYSKVIIINGKKCIVLKPDGFNSEVKDSYTADEWATAEASGLVALPFAGYHNGTNITSVDIGGIFWSATPNGSDDAYNANFSSGFSSDIVETKDNDRNYGFCVRLVSVQ